MKDKLINKLTSKKASIGIIGLGYVGLPLALAYSKEGYKVLGIDQDQEKVISINEGKSFIKHIESSDINKALEQGLKATNEFSEIGNIDALIICVPTPLNSYKEPDLTYVIDSITSSIPYLKKGQAICLVSTTYPGTTEEELLPRIESEGLKVGKDIFLIYSPEREDPGNIDFKTGSIPKVVGGYTEDCLEVGISLFEKVIEKIVPVSSLKVAEITKLLENIYRAVNIGLVNDMKKITDKMDIDIFEVINAASTKPFGFKPFYPGPGLGGHCIPIDPFYLSWKSKQYGIYNHFIELAGEINTEMPNWVIEKTVSALNNSSKSLRDSKVLVLGVSYKKDVDDLRESPALTIIEKLLKKGAKVSFSDPNISSVNLKESSVLLESIKLTEESLSDFDVIIVVTDHTDFDYELIKRASKLIVDTRGVFDIEDGKIFRA